MEDRIEHLHVLSVICDMYLYIYIYIHIYTHMHMCIHTYKERLGHIISYHIIVYHIILYRPQRRTSSPAP